MKDIVDKLELKSGYGSHYELVRKFATIEVQTNVLRTLQSTKPNEPSLTFTSQILHITSILGVRKLRIN